MKKHLFFIILLAVLCAACEKVDDELYKPFLQSEEGKIVNPEGTDEVRKDPNYNEYSVVTQGIWYLRDYDQTSAVFQNPDLSAVTWGEYINFAYEGTMYWEKRLKVSRKQASIFNYTLTGNVIQLKSTAYSESYSFTIMDYDEERLCVRCSDGIYRYFTRSR